MLNLRTADRSRLLHPLLWLFLLALAVRLIGLTYHSLWFDEVVSTVWAAKPAGEIWRAGLSFVQDKHPPLYYLLLHGWTRLLGESDVSVRLLGVLIGALAVLPTYGIGRRLGGDRAGALAALLLALNPFLIWYSQEARMFMPATTFLLVGLYGTLHLVYPFPGGRHPQLDLKTPEQVRASVSRAGLLDLSRSFHPSGYRQAGPEVTFWLPPATLSALLVILGFTAALYSYLFSAFMLPVAGLWVLLLAWQGRNTPGNARRSLVGLGSLAAVAILFLPLARNAWSISGTESVPGRAFAGAAQALVPLLATYAVGWPRWIGSLGTALVVAAALLALVGMLAPDRWLLASGLDTRDGQATADRHVTSSPSIPRGGLFLAIWLGVPLLLGGLLLARDRTLFDESRYFIFLVPALCLAWGRGLAAAWGWHRAAGWAALVVALMVTLAALPANWSPERRREAWRETAALIQAYAGPNDAVLLYPDYLRSALERYSDGDQPLFTPFTEALGDPATIDGPLQGLSSFDATWLVESHHESLDPANLLSGWFAARYPLITEQFPAGVLVHAFATRYRTVELPAYVPALNPQASLGPLQLLACVHDPGPLAAIDDLYHPPSNWVHVTTYWTTDETPSTDVFPQVRLVDQAGQVWGDKLERSNDAIHMWPTSRWIPGEVVRVDSDVNINPITPPGRYRLVVGLPDGGESVVCGDVEIK